ncbi:hypothetical protein [Streptomyces sp. NPDC049970]|uniref:hypothetical protein n=1 Tax=Streptomyces sp. NPDC049970 TaxID=3155033 RepID=UPI003430DAD8
MTNDNDPRTEPVSSTEPRHTTAPRTTREAATGADTPRESVTGARATPGITGEREPVTGTGVTPGTTREPATAVGTTTGTTRESALSADSRTAHDTSAGVTAGDGRSRQAKAAGTGDHSVPPAPRKDAGASSHERTGHHAGTGSDQPLVSRNDQEKLAQRMHHAVADFVESPRRAVEEADSTFEQIVSGLTEALTERRRALRASWQEQDTEAQTEELRIALQRYRDLGEQLLKI